MDSITTFVTDFDQYTKFRFQVVSDISKLPNNVANVVFTTDLIALGMAKKGEEILTDFEKTLCELNKIKAYPNNRNRNLAKKIAQLNEFIDRLCNVRTYFHMLNVSNDKLPGNLKYVVKELNKEEKPSYFIDQELELQLIESQNYNEDCKQLFDNYSKSMNDKFIRMKSLHETYFESLCVVQ